MPGVLFSRDKDDSTIRDPLSHCHSSAGVPQHSPLAAPAASRSPFCSSNALILLTYGSILTSSPGGVPRTHAPPGFPPDLPAPRDSGWTPHFQMHTRSQSVHHCDTCTQHEVHLTARLTRDSSQGTNERLNTNFEYQVHCQPETQCRPAKRQEE